MSDFSCEQCRDLLPLQTPDALPPDEADLVEQHLAECAECHALSGQWQAIAAATRVAFDRIPVPSDEQIARLPVSVLLSEEPP